LAVLLEVLKALADESRLALVKLLLRRDYCVGALAMHLNISESAVSQHLRVLRVAGIVKGEKRGYFTHYWVDRDFLASIAKDLTSLSLTKADLEKDQKNTLSQKKCCKKED
jgi:ArsR family transcriptional regulator, arsenate/arsenite/antimonite-responsive transcriptional repressor